ncbi:hypothetical protein [Mycobacterium sp. UM_Kg1]|uniref:hypothetical protein n=1 Tax=Mycobacterium sp. UM_Kg1 TaxID=1545691 RepID=UPI000A61EE7C|nr:hypothetical protein [Mycobacterium sp. UM_Kg1]
MEHAPRTHAAVAVILAGAGLLAAGPPSTQVGQTAAVQLTAGAADFTILPYPRGTAADLLPALGGNLALAGSQVQEGLSDLFELDFLGAAGNFASAGANLFPAIPENILLAAVGGVLGQNFSSYLTFAGDFAVNPPLTDWSTLVPSLAELLQAGAYQLSAAVQSFFAGDIADSLYHTLAGIDDLFVMLPAMVFLGVPALLGDSLLDLVGL